MRVRGPDLRRRHAVQTGATQLADGLTQAVDQIPTYFADDIGILSVVAAQPVRADQVRPEPGMQAVPFFAVIALWIGALVDALAWSASGSWVCCSCSRVSSGDVRCAGWSLPRRPP